MSGLKYVKYTLDSCVGAYLNGEIDSEEFVKSYEGLWRQWRDNPELQQLNAENDNIYDRLFTACDCFELDLDFKSVAGIDAKSFRLEVENMYALLNHRP